MFLSPKNNFIRNKIKNLHQFLLYNNAANQKFFTTTTSLRLYLNQAPCINQLFRRLNIKGPAKKIMSQAKESRLQELPRQPVPDLDKTLERYLCGLRAVVPAAQYEKTRLLVEQFRADPGPRLQAELTKLAENVDNWALHFWVDDMYLNNPVPLPIFSNPFMLAPKQVFHSTSDQLRFTARVIRNVIQIQSRLQSDEVEPDFTLGKDGQRRYLCMRTYQFFFSAYRRPGEHKDEIAVSQQQNLNNPWHIIVACKNQFFTVQVKPADSEELLSVDVLTEQLRQVTQMAKDKESMQPPVGVLTTEERPTWARMRNKMLKSKVNAENFRAIENCFFVVCLDLGTPSVPSYSTIRKDSTTLEVTTMGSHLLHGSGTDVASANRWYDKFAQVIVTREGFWGFVFEHSPADGMTLSRMFEELNEKMPVFQFSDVMYQPPRIRTETEENSVQNSAATEATPFRPPTPLNWEIDDEISNAIQEASRKINKMCNDVDLFYHRFSKYGKDFIKSHKMSPDAYIQIALQLTYYKVHRKLVSTYESASLRTFHHGRIDSIRASTPEALEWVKVMCDAPEVTEETKVKLFKLCMKKHTEIMRYTLQGEGPDNHLLALREIAKSKNYPEIPLFKDKSYAEYLNFRLSTSQVPQLIPESKKVTTFDIIVGYGPVVADGYGCCYAVYSDHLSFVISSLFSSKETSSDFFAHSLEGSLLQMEEICEKMKIMESEAQKQALADN